MESGLSFSTTDLSQTRFAISPMWEVVTSFRTLSQGLESAPHGRWAAQVRPRVVRAGLDRGWLAALVPDQGYLADFLNPIPTGPFPSLAAELDAIRRTPAGRVRDDLDGLRTKRGDEPLAALLRADPEAVLLKVADEVETYWELALAPYWARIQKVLEADVFHRARQVAEHGSARVLGELHETVRWDGDGLRLVRRHCALTRDRAGSGLLLVPSVFVWPRVLTRSVHPDPPQLAYPALGFGTVWEPRTTEATDAVAAVLGRSRTLLLAELDTPASTTRLAAHCGMSAANVSQHLIALRNAGLVTAHRSGRSVLYARTAVADQLLRP
ncbi:DUF5937 family protein [Streptomyces sp. NPDC058877]|uniref:ArsR/SmtB family transcription factor n=1 Tax=unclassified Streptomyces TaxID=2593676 RepID=UPI0036B1232B